MGEARRKALLARQGAGEATPAQVVDTLGGRMHVRWDEGAAATLHGQLVFFAEFLAATGVFERRVANCPLQYRSGNAPGNPFKLKNQWGLGAFTTRDINRCQQRRPQLLRWSTTGGTGTAEPRTRVGGSKRSPAVHCCWPRWARLQATPTRPRCT